MIEDTDEGFKCGECGHAGSVDEFYADDDDEMNYPQCPDCGHVDWGD